MLPARASEIRNARAGRGTTLTRMATLASPRWRGWTWLGWLTLCVACARSGPKQPATLARTTASQSALTQTKSPSSAPVAQASFGPRDFGGSKTTVVTRAGHAELEIRVPHHFSLPAQVAKSSSSEAYRRDYALTASVNDLARVLGAISGATFKIVRSDDLSRGIVLGFPSDFQRDQLPQLTEALELRANGDGREAFYIRSEAARVVLAGNTGYGLSHAVYALLKELGYRHFFQGSAWEIIPREPNLSLSLHRADRPAFLVRTLGPLGADAYFGTATLSADRSQWYRSLGLEGTSLRWSPSHGWRGVERLSFDGKPGTDIFNEHPEYILGFGKSHARSGLPFSAEVLKRNGGGDYKYDVSNAAVRALMLEAYRNKIRGASAAEEELFIGVGPSDGAGWHLEDLADPDWYRRLGYAAPGWTGSISDHVFGFANFVADQLSREFPARNVRATLMAYDVYHTPPGFKLHPNVWLSVVQGSCGSATCGLRSLQAWKAHVSGSPLMATEYLSVWLWTRGEPPASVPTSAERLKQHLYDELYQNGVRSLNAESQSDMALNGLGYYLFAAALWNPLADFAAIRKDFLERSFGPAAHEMDAYYSAMDLGNPNPPSHSSWIPAVAKLDAAGQIAQRAGDVGAVGRIDLIKQYWYYTYLKRQLDQAPEDAELRQRFLELFYRQAPSYAISFDGFSNELIRRFGDWRARLTPKQWAGSLEASGCPRDANGEFTPCSRPEWTSTPHSFTHAEAERWWAVVKAYYAPVTLEQRTYSTDYVPVREAGATHPKSCFDPGAGFAARTPIDAWLYSFHGEAIELKLYDFASSRDVVNYQATLHDRQGHQLWASGWQIVRAEKPLLLEVKVPTPGAYRIRIEHDSASLRAKPLPGYPIALNPAPSAESRIRRAGTPRQTIYVPHATSSLDLDAVVSKSGLELSSPSGRSEAPTLLAGSWSSGAILRTNVANGEAGFWQLMLPRSATLDSLRAFSAPNALANSEGYLMVPREVVSTDGLTLADGPFPQQRLRVQGLGAPFEGRYSEVLTGPEPPEQPRKSESALFRSDTRPSVYLVRSRGADPEGWFVLFDEQARSGRRYVSRARRASDVLVQDGLDQRKWQRASGASSGQEPFVTTASLTTTCE